MLPPGLLCLHAGPAPAGARSWGGTRVGRWRGPRGTSGTEGKGGLGGGIMEEGGEQSAGREEAGKAWRRKEHSRAAAAVQGVAGETGPEGSVRPAEPAKGHQSRCFPGPPLWNPSHVPWAAVAPGGGGPSGCRVGQGDSGSLEFVYSRETEAGAVGLAAHSRVTVRSHICQLQD